MPVTGLYMARRVRHSTVPYVSTYGQCVLQNVLPAFADLPEKASKIADAEFEHLGSQPATDDCDGMSEPAEAAQEKGQAFYSTMLALRQTTLNLFAAGLFHLVEQQLADLCHDATFHKPPPNDTKLSVLTDWYRAHFSLDLKALSAWPKIDQLRLIANCVKHGEGSSATQLRQLRPDLFEDPRVRELLPQFPKMYTSPSLRRPLAGEDLYVTPELFTEYSEATNRFVAEVAEYFENHGQEHYLVGG
jgi:hypothetical protein